MDAEQALREEHSKRRTCELVDWVGGNPRRFATIIALFTGGDRLIAQRAAWVVGDCAERWPRLAERHLTELLDHLERPGLHDASIRVTFRLLQFVEIPPRLEGRVCGLAMAVLGGTAPVAAKAYAITVLRRLIDRYPEIEDEVRLLIREQWSDAPPAIRSRARREFGIR